MASSWVEREACMWEPEASVYSLPGPSFGRTRHHRDYPVQRGGGGVHGREEGWKAFPGSPCSLERHLPGAREAAGISQPCN